jgi:murein DD-endopeptidase MepM/ murein hydrolase activator NlpD
VKEDLEETDAELAQAYIDLQTIEAELPVAQATLDQANATYETAQREADDLKQRLEDAEAEEATLTEEITANDEAATDAHNAVAEMARQAARGDLGITGLEFVVGAKTTDEFITQYNMSATAMRTQSSSLDDLRQTEAVSKNSQVRLDAVKVAITDLKAQADAKLAEATEAKTAAETAKAKVETLITEQAAKKKTIEDRKAAEQKRQDELESQSASLTSEIQDIVGLQESERAKIAAEQAAQQQAAESTGGSGNSGTGTPPAAGTVLAYPTAVPYVTSSYGWRLHPVLGYYRLHAGTDFRAYCGTAIYAAASGTVQWAQWKSGFGNQVLLNNGSYNGASLMTSYNHLTSFTVSSGQSVTQGQLVGYSGNTGLGTACHLHFEVYINGGTVDPMTMLN